VLEKEKLNFSFFVALPGVFCGAKALARYFKKTPLGG
jgi:hypothetical protein